MAVSTVLMIALIVSTQALALTKMDHRSLRSLSMDRAAGPAPHFCAAKRAENQKKADAEVPACFDRGTGSEQDKNQRGFTEWGEGLVVIGNTGEASGCTKVIEFGGGAGYVSTITAGRLPAAERTSHTVVQPKADGRGKEMFGGWKQNNKNRAACGLKYNLVDHILAKGDSAVMDGSGNAKIPFNCMIVDCEGCLNGEYDKNPGLFEHVKMIQVERDDGGKYDALFTSLGMAKQEDKTGCGCDGNCPTEVWTKG